LTASSGVRPWVIGIAVPPDCFFLRTGPDLNAHSSGHRRCSSLPRPKEHGNSAELMHGEALVRLLGQKHLDLRDYLLARDPLGLRLASISMLAA
jgi:hypothetical protein